MNLIECQGECNVLIGSVLLQGCRLFMLNYTMTGGSIVRCDIYVVPTNTVKFIQKVYYLREALQQN
jgi:hypothetical protein